MRTPLLTSGVALCLGLLCVVNNGLQAQAPGTQAQLTSPFTVDTTTLIPGKSLKPGKYTISVVDHLADRTILRVTDNKGHVEGTFIGLPTPKLDNGGAVGPVAWNKGPNKTEALRGYTFPGAAVEFAYPKEQAVAIAKVNDDKVPAIDPASEGRPKNDKLSDEDRRMVTLWMLSSTRIGPPAHSEPAIQAQRYQPPVPPVQEPVQTASLQQNESANVGISPQTTRRPAARVSSNRQVASARRPAPLGSLPHTASELPVIWLVGLFAVLLALGIRTYRAARS